MANKGIKRNKVAPVIKPRMGLMEEAHDHVVASYEEMTEPFGRVLQLTGGEETVQLMELKALMLARRQVLEDFFEICQEHMAFGTNGEEFQSLPQRIKNIHATEYLRLALRVRGIISQQSNEAPITKTRLNLMTTAHDHVVDKLKEGAAELRELFYLNRGQETARMVELEALLGARRKIINAFFKVCEYDRVESRKNEKALQAIPPGNRERFINIFTAEIKRLAADIKKIINRGN